MKNRSEVHIEKIEITRNKVVVHFSCNGDIKNYLNGEMFITEYNCEIDKVPESILIIPFLSTICPLSWITNATVYCDSVDEEYFHCLNVIRSSYESIYPHYSWKGTLIPKQLVNQGESRDIEPRSALFFSGGIDSIASYVQLRNKKPTLITVWGADIPFENDKGWEQVFKEVEHFATTVGSQLALIKSNFRDIINYLRLREHILRDDEHWWPNFQHGIGTIGLAAPLTYELQINNLYFAAGLNPQHKAPSASLPEIDNNIKWGDKEFFVCHHSYILRSEKVFIIRDYINSGNENLKIRVCYRSEDGKNCSKCPKCLMTIMYLLLAGLDPGRHGFKGRDEDTLEYIRSRIENGMLNVAFHRYIDIQNQIRNDKNVIPEFSRDFFDWFEKADLNKIKKKYDNTQKWYEFKWKIKKTFIKMKLIKNEGI